MNKMPHLPRSCRSEFQTFTGLLHYNPQLTGSLQSAKHIKIKLSLSTAVSQKHPNQTKPTHQKKKKQDKKTTTKTNRECIIKETNLA